MRPQFTLRSLFLASTLASLGCSGVSFVGVKEHVARQIGVGERFHLGRLAIGIVDWKDDDRGPIFSVRTDSFAIAAVGYEIRETEWMAIELPRPRSEMRRTLAVP